MISLLADRRLERKEVNIRELEEKWEEEDDIDIEDLPTWDERRPKQGMDTTKMDGRDHVTTWSESKKGKQMGQGSIQLILDQMSVDHSLWSIGLTTFRPESSGPSYSLIQFFQFQQYIPKIGLYVTTTPGLSEKELAETFDIWQLNMLNCCNFELTFLPIEETKMLVLLPDGIYLRIVRSCLMLVEQLTGVK